MLYKNFLFFGGLLLIFLLLPILGLIGTALLDMFWLNFDQAIWIAVWISLKTSSISCLIVAIFGTPLAFYFAQNPTNPVARLLQSITSLPLVLPPALVGLSLLALFTQTSFLGQLSLKLGLQIPFSTIAVSMAQVFVISPFFIRTVQLGFSGLDPKVLSAALIDGSTHWQKFWYIALPLNKKYILGGLTLSWLRALGEFGATAIFAGNLPGVTQTAPLFIYTSLYYDWSAAIAISFFMLVICWIGMIVIEKLSPR